MPRHLIPRPLCAYCKAKPVNKLGNLFCSYSCSARSREVTEEQKAILRERGRRMKTPPKQCPQCGGMFKRKGNQSTFCSRQCLAHHRYGELTKENVFRYCEPDPITGCWNWTHSKLLPNDRPVMFYYGRRQYAYRVVYALFRESIPDNLLACHTCDNPACVNPAHIFPGTHADNTQDSIRKGRWLIGELQPRAKLTENEVREIRRLQLAGHIYRDIANRFGITAGYVYSIIHRKTWKHVS